jgi:hypothetical protein
MKSFCVQSRAQRVSPIPVRDVEVLLYLKSRAERGTSIAKKALEVQS